MTSKYRLLILPFLYFLYSSTLYARDQSEVLLKLSQRIDSLDTELRSLRGENEQLQHTVDNLKKAQKNGFLGVDDRIDNLTKRIQIVAKKQTPPATASIAAKKIKKVATPTSNTTVKTPPKAKATTKPTTTTSPKTTTKQTAKKKEVKAKLTGKAEVVKAPPHKIRAATQKEKLAYNKAYATMKGNPTHAIQTFNSYMKKYPDSPLAANAQYWIGEILYSQKNYKEAVDEFVKVLQNYKKSEKASDAAIKLGFSFYELKNWVYARRALEDVSRYFPNTKAASLAKLRIAKMKADGKY